MGNERPTREELLQEVCRLQEALRQSEERSQLLLKRLSGEPSSAPHNSTILPPTDSQSRPLPDGAGVEDALRESEERYRVLVEGLGDGVHVKDAELRYVMVNSEHLRRLGRTREEVLGKTSHDLYDPDFANRTDERDLQVLGSGQTVEHIDRFPSRAHAMTCLVRKVPLRAPDGTVVGVVTVSRDITERQHAEDALRESEERYRALAEAAEDIIVILGTDGRFQYVNRFGAAQFGLPVEQLLGATVESALTSGQGERIHRKVVEASRRREALQFEEKLRLCGRDTFLHISMVPLKDKQGAVTSVLGIGRDVGELVSMREEMRTLSLADELTGLYNRRGFTVLAERQLKTATRAGRPVSLLMADVDDLKAINDQFGHLEGDSVLVAVARILRESCRDSDIVARLGGDEFTILATGASAIGMDSLTARIRAGVAAWNEAASNPSRLSLSLGVATRRVDQPEPLDALLAAADELMYDRKRRKYRGSDPNGLE